MKLFYSSAFLIIIYIVGIVGLHTQFQAFFLHTTPYAILLSAFFLISFSKENNKYFWFFLIACYVLGFSIEVIGISTGIPFGEYSYGNTLGLKLFNVPLVMGFNWVILIYCTGSICDKIKSSIFIKVLIASVMTVALDLFIEPVATKYDYWQWKNAMPPLQNYLSWLGASFLLILLFYKLPFQKSNPIAKTIFIIQCVFFALLAVY